MNLQHHFLIAMPSLEDSYFKRSVIYICEHTKEGAIGLIINKPTENFTFESLLKKLNLITNSSLLTSNLEQPIMVGGPVSEERGFILHTSKQQFDSSMQISDDTVMTTSKDVLETLGTSEQPNEILITLGCCSWDANQLEKEILQNFWLTVEADSKILFHTPIFKRWQAAAEKIGVNIHNITTQIGHA